MQSGEPFRESRRLVGASHALRQSAPPAAAELRTAALWRRDAAKYERLFLAGSRPLRTGPAKLDLSLLSDLQRVVYHNPEVANGAFELGMAEE
jgi:hypothetical protein